MRTGGFGYLCPKCSGPTEVIDSRPAGSQGVGIRRRRECKKCAERFTTQEIPYELYEVIGSPNRKWDGPVP